MIKLYDDYIEMKNKKPLGKVDAIQHYNDPPEDLDGYGGRLIDGLVLVDIDDGDQAQTLLKIINDLNINTIVRETKRGYHFYFKNNGYKRSVAPVKCPIGLTIEIKKYGKKSFEPIKVDGKIRKIVKNADFLDEVPFFLSPMKYSPDWLNMKDGDGRNQEFFNFQIKLAKNGIEYEQGKLIGEIINNYILDTPLASREFNTIWREEAYPSVTPNFYAESGSFLHNVFADFIIKKYHVVRINGGLYVYEDGLYKSEFETSTIQLKMIDEIPTIKDRQRNEALKYMKLKAPDAKLADPRYVLVGNGIYDFVEDRLLPFDYTKVFINKIEYDYHPDCYNELVDDTLDRIACGDEELYFLLTEIIGYCLYRKNAYRFCPMLVGEGSNGKSTYLKMIQHLLGDSNYSSLSLADMKNSFRPAEVASKLANLGDDIDNEYLKDTSIIKKLITGETILVEHKGSRAFKLNSYATMIFSANDLAMVSDKSKGWISRIKVVPFNASFSKSDPGYDPFIDVKLSSTDCMEYLLSIAIESMREVLKENSFTDSKAVRKMTEEYELENNTLLQYINSFEDLDSLIMGNTRGEIYVGYEAYCVGNGLHPLSSMKLSKLLISMGYETHGNAKKYRHVVQQVTYLK